MFGRKPPTSVGASTKMRGTIEGGDDDIQVDGHLEGAIQTSGDVTVSPGAAVVGDIRASSVTIGGRVDGMVVAQQRLRMMASGNLYGDAHYGTLEVERGGVIEGRATSDTDGAALPPVLPAAQLAGSREETMQFAPVVDDRTDSDQPPVSSPPATQKSSPPSSPPSAPPPSAQPPSTKPSSPPMRSAPPPPRLPGRTKDYGAGSAPPPPPKRALPKPVSTPPTTAKSEPPDNA